MLLYAAAVARRPVIFRDWLCVVQFYDDGYGNKKCPRVAFSCDVTVLARLIAKSHCLSLGHTVTTFAPIVYRLRNLDGP